MNKWRQRLATWDAQQDLYRPDRERGLRAMSDVLASALPIEHPRVLDLACGCGAVTDRILDAVPSARIIGIDRDPVLLRIAREIWTGDPRVTFEQADLRDGAWRDRHGNGRFDAVVSLGAWEHFCSLEEYQAGRQEEIYREIFRRVAGLLPPGGRFYLQTMVFGRNMIRPEQIDLNAPRDSDAYYVALMMKRFPGSWLPFGQEQLARTAAPVFRLVTRSSGRLDYIETIRQWRLRFAAPSARKTLLKLSLLPRYLFSADFRLAFTSGVSANTVCFQRELLDHFRMVFEKVEPTTATP